ncbi:hypothetical protein M427DRAFT_40635 [Gonapodya prolifera JEL478]|uniref:Methyltransferase n=1 Tax=Gonapodya prolifera (strain JEL478) TaxID=1344416 RepID=A0A139AYN4_GONPJ|nr:hypothetical protein M427DRAFT_40635 [Gonapodya prolifera JEL478]|eukprot:KXS21814.1 hypothetical protein M427DRAFT_40635 [Gonapodya prolifera JEL478]
MASASVEHTSLRSVTAALNFVDLASVPEGERPTTYFPDQNGNIRPQNFANERRDVVITDLRSAGKEFKLDRNGFELLHHKSAIQGDEFYDEEKLKKVYLPEVEEVIKKVTGASRTKVFDSIIRSPRSTFKAIDRVHGDYTTKSGAGRLIEHIPEADSERLLNGRFAIINLWRPIRTVVDAPLAVADAITSPRSEIIAQSLVYPHRVGETAAFKYNPNVQFYYVSRQTPEEPLLIKTFEKAEDKAGFVPHSAFFDPTAPPNAPERESIEVRVLVLWEDGNDQAKL